MPSFRRAVAPLLVLGPALLAACGGDATSPPPPQCSVSSVAPPAASVQPLDPGPYHALFVEAARDFGVPAALLESVGWTETRWQMVRGQEEFEGMPPAFGIMALRGAALERGAALAGVSPEAARTEARANIRAAAALLADYGRALGAQAASPASWAEAAARYSGIEVPEARMEYSTRVLAGAGVVRPLPLAYAATSPCPPPSQTDFASAIWRPSPNFNTDRRLTGDQHVHMVIVHTCEGNYAGCWGWLVDTQSQASAHYVVNDDGSEVSQLVREANRAWQIAATYHCANNFGHDCATGLYEGVQGNNFTIGIEHAGYAASTAWQPSMINTSARLVCDLSKRWSIPLDWRHIVAHGQLQPENRTDPGPNWPWAVYLGKIQRSCGQLVVDDDNARNDTSYVKVQAPAGWTSSTATGDFYAFGYRQADAAAGAAPLVFSFYLEQGGLKTVEAWWTGGADRTQQARYVAVSAAGDTLGSATLDQRTGGGGWQNVGQWSFTVGWNKVLLSGTGAAGTLVIGDAVRVR